MDNKFPGKDISNEDLISKFPLAAKKNPDHKSKFKIANVEFGGDPMNKTACLNKTFPVI